MQVPDHPPGRGPQPPPSSIEATSAGDLPETLGEVELWWVECPPSPRLTVRNAVAVAVLAAVAFLAAVVWALAGAGQVSDLWPWSRGEVSGPQVALRYLSVLLVAAVYVLVRSIPAWVRCVRTARSDLDAAEQLTRLARWRQAGIRLHRHGLLWRRVWRRLPEQVRELDGAIRRGLQRRRRLYIYYWREPPPLPETPEAGFSPRIVPAAITRWWTLPVFIVLLATAYAELTGTLHGQQWRTLRAVNFVVLTALLGGYGYVYLTVALGRRDFFRFAPGVAELLIFGVVGRRAKVRSIRLRDGDVVLDLTGSSLVLAALSGSAGQRARRYYLARRPEVIEACLRAAMHPLPETQLVD